VPIMAVHPAADLENEEQPHSVRAPRKRRPRTRRLAARRTGADSPRLSYEGGGGRAATANKKLGSTVTTGFAAHLLVCEGTRTPWSQLWPRAPHTRHH